MVSNTLSVILTTSFPVPEGKGSRKRGWYLQRLISVLAVCKINSVIWGKVLFGKFSGLRNRLDKLSFVLWWNAEKKIFTRIFCTYRENEFYFKCYYNKKTIPFFSSNSESVFA